MVSTTSTTPPGRVSQVQLNAYWRKNLALCPVFWRARVKGAALPSSNASTAASLSTASLAASAADSVASCPQPSPPAAVVLGIESSCDDTGVAVVTSDGRVLGEAIATQADIHAQWGGVVPNLARDAHAAAIDATVDSALAAAGLPPQQLSAVAVTVGPGLGLCLRVGAAKARQLARQYGIPLISIHHMEAHALVARLPAAAAAAAPPPVRMATVLAAAAAVEPAAAAAEPTRGSAINPSQLPHQLKLISQQLDPNPHSESHRDLTAEDGEAAAALASTSGRGTVAAMAAAVAAADPAAVLADATSAAAVPFPFLCLLVSGGHNLLVLVSGVGGYVQLGTTVDDALGEAYDKVARLLNLELRPHGGAALEALAKEGDPGACRFAVPMRKHATCDFSFAGLKTNTRLAIEQQLDPQRTAGMSPEQIRQVKADIAASFQSVAVTHLTEKTRRGVAWARELAPELRHLVVAGGVACNLEVRSSLQRLAEEAGLELVLPPPRWCTDNGVMVAWAGVERLARGWAETPPPPSPAAGAEMEAVGPSHASTQAQEWIDLKPRWPLTSELHPRTAAAQQELRRSVRRVRLATPLSDLVPPPSAAAPPLAAEAAAAAPARSAEGVAGMAAGAGGGGGGGTRDVRGARWGAAAGEAGSKWAGG